MKPIYIEKVISHSGILPSRYPSRNVNMRMFDITYAHSLGPVFSNNVIHLLDGIEGMIIGFGEGIPGRCNCGTSNNAQNPTISLQKEKGKKAQPCGTVLGLGKC